jgi:hypothetical protein
MEDEDGDANQDEVEAFKFSESAGVSEEYTKLLEEGDANNIISSAIEEEINIDDL